MCSLSQLRNPVLQLSRLRLLSVVSHRREGTGTVLPKVSRIRISRPFVEPGGEGCEAVQLPSLVTTSCFSHQAQNWAALLVSPDGPLSCQHLGQVPLAQARFLMAVPGRVGPDLQGCGEAREVCGKCLHFSDQRGPHPTSTFYILRIVKVNQIDIRLISYFNKLHS